MILNSTNCAYLISKETPINHHLFMDELKLYGKTERELKSLVHTVRIGQMQYCAYKERENLRYEGYRNPGWTTYETKLRKWL